MSLLDEACTVCGAVRRDCLGRPHVPSAPAWGIGPPPPEWTMSDTITVHEAVPILKYFRFDHLPPKLQNVSQGFHIMAHDLVAKLPNGPERAVALRKLLESKDAAVRAAMEEG